MKRHLNGLILRYLILLIIALFGLPILTKILSFLTIKAVFIILNIFYTTNISEDVIIFNSIAIRLIPACIAVSAYYLLLIFNLTNSMGLKTRTKSIFFLLISFFTINLIRIITIAIIFERGYKYFDLIHSFSWHVLSTFMVLFLWFINIYLFKIKSIPIYTDVKEVLKIIKSSKKHDKRNPK